MFQRQKLKKTNAPYDSKSSPNESSYGLAKHPTSLSMGLKDLLPFGKKNGDDDSRSEDPEDIKLALEAIKADLEAVSALGSKRPSAVRRKATPIEEINEEEPKKKKRQLGGIPLPKPTNRSDTSRFDESVKDRMTRIKSGIMTDEEKAAFLNNALTRTPQGSQKIRKDESVTKTATIASSPYARDALWSQITKDKGSRNESSKGRYVSSGPKDLNEKAKRQYLDRVTDPDRFKSYAAMGGYKNEPPSNEDEQGDAETTVPDFEETQVENVVPSSSIDERENLVNEQRQRALEMQRAGETAMTNVTIETKENDSPQLQSLPDLLKAQDEYWAKKLEEENRRKEAKMSEMEKEEFRKKREKEEAAKVAAQAKRDIEQAEIERLREEERMREDPHESEILKEAAEDELHDRELNADIMEISSAKTSRTVPQKRPEDVSAQSFVTERDNERAVLERIKKENQARLAGLNSPLPSPSKKVPTPSPPISQLEKMRKEQQARLAELNSPLPSPVKTMTSPKSDFTASALDTPLQSQSSNVKSPSVSPLSDINSPSSTSSPSEPLSDDASTAPESTQDPPRLNLFDMTMRKGSSSTSASAAPSSSSSPAKRAPIRQKIEIDDEEDDDDEDDEFFQFTRNGRNSGMSIKDIMGSKKSEPSKDQSAKAKSKMWGIDIDRFS